MVAMSGFGEPRRENCPLDDFLFLLFESTLIKKKIKTITFFSYSFIYGSDEWIRTADLTGMNRLL